MEKKDVINFMKRIKSHYQEFVVDDFKISEWYGFLKDYDDEDVNKKFEEHLNSEVYGNQIPRIAFLTKFLIKSKDKGKIKHYTVLCPKCGQAVPDVQLEKHTQRCIEAHSIIRDMKKYYNIRVDFQELIEMSNEKFEKTYQKYLDKMIEAPIPDFQKRVIMHIKYPEYTSEDINEIIKLMISKEDKEK